MYLCLTKVKTERSRILTTGNFAGFLRRGDFGVRGRYYGCMTSLVALLALSSPSASAPARAEFLPGLYSGYTHWFYFGNDGDGKVNVGWSFHDGRPVVMATFRQVPTGEYAFRWETNTGLPLTDTGRLNAFRADVNRAGDTHLRWLGEGWVDTGSPQLGVRLAFGNGSAFQGPVWPVEGGPTYEGVWKGNQVVLDFDQGAAVWRGLTYSMTVKEYGARAIVTMSDANRGSDLGAFALAWAPTVQDCREMRASGRAKCSRLVLFDWVAGKRFAHPTELSRG